METLKNQNLQGKSFCLEEVVFMNCMLTDCDFYYSGGDFEWVNSNFDNCRFHWRGPAKNTVALAQAIGMIKTSNAPPTVIPTSQKPN